MEDVNDTNDLGRVAEEFRKNHPDQWITYDRDAKHAKSFIIILVWTCLTFSIYWWIFLFKTLNRLGRRFKFYSYEITPRQVKRLLIFTLVVNIVLQFVCFYLTENLSNPILFRRPLLVLGNPMEIKYLAFYVWLASEFVIYFAIILVLAKTQVKAGIQVFDKAAVWIFLAGLTISDLFSDRHFAIALYSLVARLVISYIIVRQANRIWLRGYSSEAKTAMEPGNLANPTIADDAPERNTEGSSEFSPQLTPSLQSHKKKRLGWVFFAIAVMLGLAWWFIGNIELGKITTSVGQLKITVSNSASYHRALVMMDEIMGNESRKREYLSSLWILCGYSCLVSSAIGAFLIIRSNITKRRR